MKTTILMMAVVCALILAPVGSANHGLTGELTGVLTSGSIAAASLSYVTGNFDTQTWSLSWTLTGVDGVVSFTCLGFGSVEVGFTSNIAGPCEHDFTTGPTGDQHPFPHSEPDTHLIDIEVNGASGLALQTIAPDV